MKNYRGQVKGIIINFPTPYAAGAPFTIVDQNKIGETKFTGNSQLPSSMKDFMFTPELLRLCEDLLARNYIPNGHQSTEIDDKKDIDIENEACRVTRLLSCPFLYVQSNVEDVAMTIRDTIEASSKLSLFGSGDDDDEGDNNNQNNNNDDYERGGGWAGRTYGPDMEVEDHDIVTPPLMTQRQERWNKLSSLKEKHSLLTEHGQQYRFNNGWLRQSPFHGVCKSETEVACEQSGKPVYRMMFTVRKS